MSRKTLKVLHGSDIEYSFCKESSLRFQLKEPLGFYYLGPKEIEELMQVLESAQKRIKRIEQKRYNEILQRHAHKSIQLDLLSTMS